MKEDKREKEIFLKKIKKDLKEIEKILSSINLRSKSGRNSSILMCKLDTIRKELNFSSKGFVEKAETFYKAEKIIKKIKKELKNFQKGIIKKFPMEKLLNLCDQLSGLFQENRPVAIA
ncbi:hypothetical protein CSB11_01710 [Candidatus Campbellbacteria bacterium]|nr:MAG: hypothetical protein CSB11_01710 [Candidatus Campbellbacteria bacterium]